MKQHTETTLKVKLIMTLTLLIFTKLVFSQKRCIEFDSSNCIYNYGTITRLEANQGELFLMFKNKSNKTLYFNNNATAYNDVPSFSPYAHSKDTILPYKKGVYKVSLKLFQKSRLQRYGDIQFTDNKGYTEIHHIELKAEIVDSLLPIFKDYILDIPFRKDSSYYDPVRKQKASYGDGEYKIDLNKYGLSFEKDSLFTFQIKNLSNYNIIVQQDKISLNKDKVQNISFERNKEFVELKPNQKMKTNLKLKMNKFREQHEYLEIAVITNRGILFRQNIKLHIEN